MEFNLDELTELFGNPKATDELSAIINNVHFDSRKITTDGLFVALSGENETGAHYCKNAVENGAIAILANEEDKEIIEDLRPGVPVFYVKNSLKSFGELGAYLRRKFKGEVIGVIGSAGKTSTKTLLFYAGGGPEDVSASKASFNNETGVPLTLCEIKESSKRTIVEMGEMNFGDLDYVANFAKPNTLVVTNVGSAHLESLGDPAGVAKTLNEAVLHLEVDSFLVIPNDIKHKDILLSANKSIVIEVVEAAQLPAQQLDNEFYITNIVSNEDLTHEVEFSFRGENAKCSIPLTGRHFVIDAGLAVCASVLNGDDLKVASANIGSAVPTGHRMRIVKGTQITLFDDCYNANPNSMKACIDTLKNYAQKNQIRSVMVMGKMAELGKHSLGSHKDVISYAVAEINQVICVGEEMKQALEQLETSEKVVHFDTPHDCAQGISKYLEDNVCVAVKASRGPIAARPTLLEVVEYIEALIEKES